MATYREAAMEKKESDGYCEEGAGGRESLFGMYRVVSRATRQVSDPSLSVPSSDSDSH